MPSGFELTEGQRRHLQIALSRLSLETRQIATRLVARGGDSEHVRSTLESIRQDAQDLAAVLGLELQEPRRDWRRRIQAWASVWWADILDCGPERLRGYGKVDPELVPVLGTRVEALAARLLHLSQHVAAAGPEP